MTLLIATYNIHKCRGMDGRTSPERVAEVISGLDADVVALQEVVRGRGKLDQLEGIARKLKGYDYCFGKTRDIRGADYGNAVLSRLPLRGHEHYNITASWREPRGCLRAEIGLKQVARKRLQLFNVHLGTGYIERRKQAHLLVADQLLSDPAFSGSRIVLGDFNEWTRGLATRMLSSHLESVDVRKFLKRRRTYPGILPLTHLDHIYFDPDFQLRNFTVVKNKLAKMASDHLPLVAEFSVAA